MYWIIEPHADDAFLSLHAHITAWVAEKIPVSLVTVYGDHVRNSEAAQYAERIGAGHIALQIQERTILKMAPISIAPLADWPISVGVDDRFIFPLGLAHPEHLETRKHAPNGGWLYVDIPYQARLSVAEELQSKLIGRRLISVRYPTRAKQEFIGVFGSQTSFFRDGLGFISGRVDFLCNIPEILIESEYV